MAGVTSLRIDPEIEAALQVLGETYGNRSDTLRTAVLRLARDKERQALRDEVAEVANDPRDRAEMAAVLAELEALGEG